MTPQLHSLGGLLDFGRGKFTSRRLGLPNLDSQVTRRAQQGHGGRHNSRGAVVSVIVDVRGLSSLEFIDYRLTEQPHNHPCLVMLGRRKNKKNGKNIKATADDLLLRI